MKKFFLKKIFNFLFFFFKKTNFFRTFSQEGEDLIIDRLLKENKIDYKELYYLDIGSGHPIKYSNTFYFYLRGSKGVTVDGYKKNTDLHKILRPRDRSFNLLLGNKNELVNYYIYDETELNTINYNRVSKLKSYGIFSKDIKKTNKKNFNDFIKENIKLDLKKINLFNLDIEGSEVELLNCLNWNNFNPKIICIEIIIKNFESIFEAEIYKILKSKDYTLFSKLYNSVIFIKT